MVYPCIQHLTILFALLLASIINVNAVSLPKIDQNDLEGHGSYQLAYRSPAVPANLETSFYHVSESTQGNFENLLDKRQRLNFDQFWTRIRLGTLWIVWSGTRLDAHTNPNPSPPGKFIQSLQNMYTQIRKAAVNQWARLPPQSYVRVIYGQIILTILPPADRTVPWSAVEELAYGLTLMISAGLGGLVTGTYLPIGTSVVFYIYLQVIQPLPPGHASTGGSSGTTFVPPPPQRRE